MAAGGCLVQRGGERFYPGFRARDRDERYQQVKGTFGPGMRGLRTRV